MDLTTTEPVPAGPRATASCNRFSVSVSRYELAVLSVKAAVAKRKDVHTSMAGSAGSEGLEHDVGDSLGCASIASANSGVRGWVEQSSFWDDDCDGFHTPYS